MDSLSQLLSLGRARVVLDVQCRLSGDYLIPHAECDAGEASFHFVLAGQCQLRVQQQTIGMSAGDFVLLAGGDSHDVKSAAVSGKASSPPEITLSRGSALPQKANLARAEAADVDLLCGRFLWDPGVGEIFLGALPRMMQANLLGATAIETLKPLIDLLRHEAAHAEPGAVEIVGALGQAILALALREFGAAQSGQTHWLTLLADVRLGPSIKAVLENPGRDWTVEALGKRVGMSRATYVRQFRSKAGMSVGAFLLGIRMMTACHLIKNSQRGLSEIAQSVGYQSEAAFGKAFQKILGDTPGRWRRAQRRASESQSAGRMAAAAWPR